MKALKVRDNLRKKEYHEQVKKDVLKHCRKYLEETEADMREIQRLNAIMHVLWLMVVLHDEFGFGKMRLQRLWNAFGCMGERLNTDRQDGIAFTKILNILENDIGMDTYVDRKLAQKLDLLYERNVDRYGEGVIEPEKFCKEVQG